MVTPHRRLARLPIYALFALAFDLYWFTKSFTFRVQKAHTARFLVKMVCHTTPRGKCAVRAFWTPRTAFSASGLACTTDSTAVPTARRNRVQCARHASRNGRRSPCKPFRSDSPHPFRLRVAVFVSKGSPNIGGTFGSIYIMLQPGLSTQSVLRSRLCLHVAHNRCSVYGASYMLPESPYSAFPRGG
jgi:hypothetical protein